MIGTWGTIPAIFCKASIPFMSGILMSKIIKSGGADVTIFNACRAVEATETSYSFAREYVRVMEIAFKSGVATSINVVDAQLALSRVKIEKLNAAYRFDVALAELLEASGSSNQFEIYRKNKAAEEIH